MIFSINSTMSVLQVQHKPQVARLSIQEKAGRIKATWGIVKIMVPFWVPIIIRGLIRGLI